MSQGGLLLDMHIIRGARRGGGAYVRMAVLVACGGGSRLRRGVCCVVICVAGLPWLLEVRAAVRSHRLGPFSEVQLYSAEVNTVQTRRTF